MNKQSKIFFLVFFLLIAGEFDMIITDIVMPGMDGQEVVRHLREIEEKKHIPIFTLSASLEEHHLKALSASGLVNQSFLKTQITPSEPAYAVNDFFKERK